LISYNEKVSLKNSTKEFRLAMTAASAERWTDGWKL